MDCERKTHSRSVHFHGIAWCNDEMRLIVRYFRFAGGVFHDSLISSDVTIGIFVAPLGAQIESPQREVWPPGSNR